MERKNEFTFTGTLHALKNSPYEKQACSGGYTKNTLQFRMVCGDSSFFLKSTGFTNFQDFKPLIKSNGGEKKYVNAKMAWEDRNKPEVLAQIAQFTKNGMKFQTREGEVVKEFATAWDFTEALNDQFVQGRFDTGVYAVSGKIEYYYNNKNGKYVPSYVVESIAQVPDDTTQTATAVLNLYYSNEVSSALNTDMFKEENYLSFTAGTPYVAYGNKQRYFADYTIDIINDRDVPGFVDLMKTHLHISDRKNVQYIKVRVELFNGSPKETVAPTSVETNDLMKAGLIDAEDLVKAARSYRGEYSERIVLRKFMPGSTSGSIIVEDVTTEDLFKRPDDSSSASKSVGTTSIDEDLPF